MAGGAELIQVTELIGAQHAHAPSTAALDQERKTRPNPGLRTGENGEATWTFVQHAIAGLDYVIQGARTFARGLGGHSEDASDARRWGRGARSHANHNTRGPMNMHVVGAQGPTKRLVVVADNSLIVEAIAIGLRKSGAFKLLGHVNARTGSIQAIVEAGPDVVLIDDLDGSDESVELVAENQGRSRSAWP